MKKFHPSGVARIASFCALAAFASFPSGAQTLVTPETTAPNNNPATAMPVNLGSPVKIRGNLFPIADVDYYAFSANAGDKLFATGMTSFSAGNSTGGLLTLYGTDGTTVIEIDDDNGTFLTTSPSIAGAIIPTTGTYYLAFSDLLGTTTIKGYDLYMNLVPGNPVAETEPNNSTATANVLPVSGFVEGVRENATDVDYYAITLAAGESVFISLDLDPEKDGVFFNGRIGFGLLGDAADQLVFADDPNAAEAAGRYQSEALFFTVKQAGTYYITAGSAGTTGDVTATYRLAVARYAAQGGYTSYTSSDVKTIGPGTGLVTSTLNIPIDTLIGDISIRLNLTHALMNDIDAILTTPTGESIALFTDIGSAVAGTQTIMDIILNDNAALPVSATPFLRDVVVMPELNSKLEQLYNMHTQGTWTLTLYDDGANVSGGTLNSWGIDILPRPAIVTGTVIASENFESSDGGFTHSGAADEWQYGTPATPATTTANPALGFTTANSGTKCWKTDLTGTYNVNAAQVLQSPVYDLTTVTGNVYGSWAMKYQMESANFDKLEVFAEEEPGGSGLLVPMYSWYGATQTTSVGNPAVNIPMSGGWGTYYADLSVFAGKRFKIKFSVVTDNTVNFSGVGIDDVSVFNVSVLPLVSNNLAGQRLGSANKLHWSLTCNNEPGARVVLQRSTDGTTFTDITNETVDALRCEQPFDYLDVNSPAGKNFYRVKMTAATGRISYSNTILLLNKNTGLELLAISPNPVTTRRFVLNVSSAEAASMQVLITDMQGRMISTETVTLLAGYNSLPVMAPVPSGVYYVQGLTKSGRTAAVKMVKQ